MSNRPCGRIPAEERFWSKVRKSEAGDGCWEWTAAHAKKTERFPGRLEYGFFHDENHRLVYAHRFSYELHYGKVPDGLCVLHSCDNPKCVRPDHLWLGTYLDNMRDCLAKGRFATGLRSGVYTKPESRATGNRNGARTKPERHARGERSGNAKFTQDQVREMRERYRRGGVTLQSLADEYGTWKSVMSRIVRGLVYKEDVITPDAPTCR